MASNYENNAFLPGESAAVAANLVAEEFDLAALINHDTGNKILEPGRKGRSIQVKQPVALVAHGRDIDDVTNEIVMDRIAESYVDLTLGVHAYNAVALSEGDLSLDIEDFSEQVLAPQAKAVAAFMNEAVRQALLAEAVTTLFVNGDATGAPILYDADNPTKFFTQVRKALRDRGVPTANLRMLVGTDVYANLLDAKALEDVSQSGSTAALREAQVGKVRGFTVAESTEVDATEIFAFHRDAFTLGMRAPEQPRGASWGATVSEAGVPIRHLMDYDLRYTADRSMLSTFVGVAKMPLFKVERTTDTTLQGDVAWTAGSATVTQVPEGAVLRVDTANQDGIDPTP